MNPLSTVTSILTLPARTAGAVAVAGVRTTSRVVGWALEQAVGSGAPTRAEGLVTVPEPRTATQTATPAPAPAPTAVPTAVPTPAPEPAKKKVPADQVPLKSAPTPSMPAGMDRFDGPDEALEPAPRKTAPKPAAKKAAAKKTPAKKTAARKTAAKKAPSKQAAVLAPALGLSEAEVVEVVEGSGTATDER